jgi:outer membrane protein OmpA-like peptidoglycan-associated protein
MPIAQPAAQVPPSVVANGNGLIAGTISDGEHPFSTRVVVTRGDEQVRAFGQVTDFNCELAPGDYEVRVESSAHMRYVRHVTVRVGERTDLQVVMRTALPSRLLQRGDFVTPKEAVGFVFSEAIVQPSTQAMLDELADMMLRYPNMHVMVVGHGEVLGRAEMAQGTPDFHEHLYERRLRALADALIERGIDPDRVKIYADPLATVMAADGVDEAARRAHYQFQITER